MASPSVTYTFSNGATADATQVNQNFTDLIAAMTDGSKSFSIDALTVAGAATLNGAVTLGNATSDDITCIGYFASALVPKTDDTYDLGSATNKWQDIYIDGVGYLDGLNLGADTMSEYAIGTYSATIRSSVNSISSIGWTSGFPVGFYIKIGKLVYFMTSLRWSSVTIGSASGELLIDLPFAVKNATNYGPTFSCFLSNINTGSGTMWVGYGYAGQARAAIASTADNGALSLEQVAVIDGGTFDKIIYMNGCYLID